MRLRELRIKNFGKFHQESIELKDGINLIYGENESGKSTVHAFVRSMLFGIQKKRGRAAKTDAYNQYKPWENAAVYEGDLRFESGGKLFRLERNFYHEDTREELICETDGERMSIEDGDLDVLLGNITQPIYDNTVSVGQMKARTDEELITILRNYMANYQTEGEDNLDLEQAFKTLKLKKKQLEEKRQEHLHRLDEEEKQLHTKMRYVEDEIARKSHQLEMARSAVQDDAEGGDETELLKDTSGEKKTFKALTWILYLVLFAVSVAIIFLSDNMILKLGAGIVILLVLFFASGTRKKGNRDTIRTEAVEEIDRQELRWKVHRFKQELQEQKMMLESFRDEEQELRMAMAEPSGYEGDIEAVDIAVREITEIAKEMQQKIGIRLKSRISEILQELTDGRYTNVSINEKLEMELYTSERCVPLHAVSSGTIEQVYFALRMAVMEILCGEEEMPVILDEIFAMYDEKRMRRALNWLYKNRGQVLVFTCQDREERILQTMGVLYNKIVL